ncbi:DUF4221 family protein [Pontibacter sp. G13]|uniref:DUF4221 family protein n=1 Tax=Pontibacter sp. G13 TaxID=3074898 RepID=UPI002889BA1F|nr:DUF4221 family protein [Pontibacter sp. G13]WNJ20275.1 DUF4221 family protein [Pontibacter sp. G13]
MRYTLYIVGLLLSLVIVSYSNFGNWNEVTFKATGEIKLNLSPKQYWAPIGVQYLPGPNPRLFLNDPDQHAIIEYDANSGAILRQIPVRPFQNDRDELRKFQYINEDSIFCLFNAAKHPDYWHDSTLIMINSSGSIQQVLDWGKSPFPSSSNPNPSKEEAYVSQGFYSFFVDRSKVMFRIQRYGTGMGDPDYGTPNVSGFGIWDLSEPTSGLKLDKVMLPQAKGQYYPFDFACMPGVLLPNHEILYGINTHPIWMKKDQNGQISRGTFAPSVVFDTIPAIKEGKQILFYRRTLPSGTPKYLGWHYDPYRDYLVRFLKYPIKTDNSTSQKTQGRFGVMVFDREMNLLGEGLIPKGHLHNVFFTPEGIAMWNESASNQNALEISYSVFEYQFSESSPEAFRDKAITDAQKRKPGGWNAYISEDLGISGDKFGVLFIPAGLGCPSCLDEMLDYFIQLDQTNFSYPLFCVVSGSNPSVIDHKLDNHQVNRGFPNLIVDEHASFYQYVGEDFQQGRLLMFDDGSFSAETRIQPNMLPAIPMIIQDFLGE